MKPEDVFGIILRVLGLGFLTAFIIYSYSLVAAILQGPIEGSSHPVAYVVAMVVCLTAGLYFLRGAKLLIRFCYPQEK